MDGDRSHYFHTGVVRKGSSAEKGGASILCTREGKKKPLTSCQRRVSKTIVPREPADAVFAEG